MNIQTRLSNSLPKSPLLPTNSYRNTTYVMSSHLIEAGPVNSAENVLAIARSEACEGSNTLSKSTSLYKGLDWDRVIQYQQPYRDLLRSPSFI